MPVLNPKRIYKIKDEIYEIYEIDTEEMEKLTEVSYYDSICLRLRQ